MTNICAKAQILSLITNSFSIDEVGPYSSYPYLALEIEDLPANIVSGLRALPCPLIGIGLGDGAKYCDVIIDTEKDLYLLDKNIRKAPLTALILVQHLRLTEGLSTSDALNAESLAFATVQQGADFQNWKKAGVGRRGPTDDPKKMLNAECDVTAGPVNIDRPEDGLTITLANPGALNVIDVTMRDALVEAFRLAQLDPDIDQLTLNAEGRAFSVGAAVDEFGTVSDPATAHWIRALRLPARVFSKISAQKIVDVQGAAIGAGAELAAFADHVQASKRAWFQLPELKYGLIPGAGGTVSFSRRIGRQKTAYLALSMRKLRAEQALRWGLVDEIY